MAVRERQQRGTSFGPMPAGSTSLGTRQNGQCFFPGCMREVDFYNSALLASQPSKT
jgi:hypothetical protein